MDFKMAATVKSPSSDIIQSPYSLYNHGGLFYRETKGNGVNVPNLTLAEYCEDVMTTADTKPVRQNPAYAGEDTVASLEFAVDDECLSIYREIPVIVDELHAQEPIGVFGIFAEEFVGGLDRRRVEYAMRRGDKASPSYNLVRLDVGSPLSHQCTPGDF